VEVGDDLHRSIRERLDSILLEQRVSNLFDSIEVELIGKVSTDGIGVWRVFGLLVESVDDKIKQMLFFDLVVCLGPCHTTSKQTLPLTRCDRLNLRVRTDVKPRWSTVERAY